MPPVPTVGNGCQVQCAELGSSREKYLCFNVFDRLSVHQTKTYYKYIGARVTQNPHPVGETVHKQRVSTQPELKRTNTELIHFDATTGIPEPLHVTRLEHAMWKEKWNTMFQHSPLGRLASVCKVSNTVGLKRGGERSA